MANVIELRTVSVTNVNVFRIDDIFLPLFAFANNEARKVGVNDCNAAVTAFSASNPPTVEFEDVFRLPPANGSNNVGFPLGCVVGCLFGCILGCLVG